MAILRRRRMKARDCGRKPGVLISSPCLSHHQETNHVPLKTSATPTGWLHGRTSEGVWRTKWKGQEIVQKGTFVYDRHGLISCMCMPWKAILIRIFLGYAVYVNGETQRGQTAYLGHIFSLKSRVELIWTKNKQTSLASAAVGNQPLQEMKMPAWNCHHIES